MISGETTRHFRGKGIPKGKINELEIDSRMKNIKHVYMDK
jgi:hypothetical protein